MKARQKLAQRGEDIKYLKIARRMRTAIQIEEAMKRRSISKSQLADLMGRRPSEVTKWLSGNHNFTQDLLAELSYYLHTEITGVSTPIREAYHTDSYSTTIVLSYPQNEVRERFSKQRKWTSVNQEAVWVKQFKPS